MYVHLDSTLRNWVFFPITIITTCVSLLMKYLTFLFNPDKKSKVYPSKTKLEAFDYSQEMKKIESDVKVPNAMKRSDLLKNNYMYISEKGFKLRKAFFTAKDTGFFNQKFESGGMDLMNPNMMFDMVKKNIINGLYYLIIFLGGGYFFSGFILLKLPFGLTQKFRSMTQQGLNLPDVDVSYVSAISWCLILVFGVDSIIKHFEGGDDEFSMVKQQMNMNPMSAMQNMPMKDYEKILKPEIESINILPQFYLLDDAIEGLFKKYHQHIKDL